MKHLKISLKNIYIGRVSYYLAERIKIINSVIGSSLFSPIPSNVGESKIDFMSGVIIMLTLLCYLSQFMIYKSI